MDEQVQAYLDAVPEDRKPLFEALHALILSLYPDAEVTLSYRMPTYKAKSGWVALGYRKDGVSLYTCGAHHLAAFRARHPKIKTGTGCINFRTGDPLPLPALKQVIRHAIEHPKPE